MSLKKRHFSDEEIPIFEDALVYKRGDYWHMRMWLSKEHKYARFSLKTRNQSTAIDKAKLHYHELMAKQLAGKTYFSITTQDGVDMYLEQRMKDVEAKLIVIGRYKTISTHLNHWLKFIHKDTKLKELERTDCENYFHSRTKVKGEEKLKVSQITVEHEQSTINSMMEWLYKKNETYIDKFDFKKLKPLDKGLEENRRQTFTDDEIASIDKAIKAYIEEAEKELGGDLALSKAITGAYLGILMVTGMRRGELLQQKWGDISDMEHKQARNKSFDLVKIIVRGETSKVRKTRRFVVRDNMYYSIALRLTRQRHIEKMTDEQLRELVKTELIFSADGKKSITTRAIDHHFKKVLEKAEVKNVDGRGLVPYSFRHYFITQRVNSNLPPSAVAEMCGTSITQIEKTYYHTTEAKMVSNALADYEYVDGILVPK
jgi:integrase